MKTTKNLKNIKNIKKIIIFSAFSAIVLIAVTVLLCRLRVKSVETFVYYQGCLSKAQGYDYILVPGAAISGAKPTTQLKDRLNTAISLYESGAAPKILLSGAYNEIENLNETTVMRIYLTSQGIPESDIICDEQGVDTAETLRRAKAFAGNKKFLVCTQSLYAERTTYLARCYGIELDIADSDVHIYTIERAKAHLRETLAATKAVLEGIFVKECVYDLNTYPFIIRRGFS